jgi:hypothetical protein
VDPVAPTDVVPAVSPRPIGFEVAKPTTSPLPTLPPEPAPLPGPATSPDMPMRQPIGFDRPVEPVTGIGPQGPQRQIGFELPESITEKIPVVPTPDPAPLPRPATSPDVPLRQPIGFDRPMEPIPGPPSGPRPPIGFEVDPTTIRMPVVDPK